MGQLPAEQKRSVFVESALGDRGRRMFGTLALALPMLWAAMNGWPMKLPVSPTGGYYLPVPDVPWYGAAKSVLLAAWAVSCLAYIASRWLPLWRKRGVVITTPDAITIEAAKRRTIPRDQVSFVTHDATRGVGLQLESGEVIRLHGARPADNHSLFSALVASAPARVHIGARAITPTGCVVPAVWLVCGVSYFALLGRVTALVAQLRLGAWLASFSALGWAVIFGGVLALAASFLRRRKLMIGRDGVRIGGVLRPRFVPFSMIKGITVRSGEMLKFVFLQLANDKRVAIPVLGDPHELAKRLREAFDAWEAAAAAPQVDALERGQLGAAEWAAAVRARAEDATYREAGLRIDDLETIVDDPRASPEQRVAAGLALASDDTGRRRVRIAAAACADPDMEAALEAAASGEVAERELTRAARRG